MVVFVVGFQRKEKSVQQYSSMKVARLFGIIRSKKQNVENANTVGVDVNAFQTYKYV